jgi:hypothetical protein
MFQKIKIIAVAVGIIFFLLSLLSVLQFFRFQNLLFDVARTRVEVPAEALKRDIERSLATGLSLQTNAQLLAMLDLVLQKNPNIFAIQIKDGLSNNTEPLWFAGNLSASSQNLDDGKLVKNHWPFFNDSSQASVFLQRWPIVDPIGTTVGQLIFTSDKSEALKMAANARRELMALLGAVCAASLLVLVPILLFLLVRLDKVVIAARSLILDQKIDQDIVAQSEVCQLAKNVRDANNSPVSIQHTGLTT